MRPGGAPVRPGTTQREQGFEGAHGPHPAPQAISRREVVHKRHAPQGACALRGIDLVSARTLVLSSAQTLVVDGNLR